MRDRLAFGLADTAVYETASPVNGGRTATAAVERSGRWRASGGPPPASPRPSDMLAVLVLSLAAHVLFLGLPLIITRSAAPAPQEKSVEVELVSEKPPAAKPEKAAPSPAKKPESKLAVPKPREPKPPEPKPAEPKPAEPVSSRPKPLEPKAAEPKPQEAKQPQAKQPQAKQPQAKQPDAKQPEAKPADAKPPAPQRAAAPPVRQEPPKAVTPPQAGEDRAQEQALERELAALNAERQALLAQQQAAADVRDAPIGSAPGTFKPVAMAGTAADGEDGASYEMLVFSQIEKAKGDDRYKGAPGAVNVRFSIDGAGRIDRIEVTTSSGRPELDAKAVAIVRAAAPFPKPPEGAQRTFTSGVTFGDVRQLLGLGGGR